MVAEINDRMPVILEPADYARWLANPLLNARRVAMFSQLALTILTLCPAAAPR